MFWDVKGQPQGKIEPDISLGDIDDPWAYPQVRHRIQLEDMVDAIKEARDPILTGEDARAFLTINMGDIRVIAQWERGHCLAAGSRRG